ncbi:type II secretion system protein [Patescibacteria group bacterium]|nr:type II secretion system protein [Patescibacteria group bacterium]
MKKKAFTIAEMVLALVVFGILFSAVMTIYVRMINVKREFDARNYLLSTTYTMLEKMNILLKDYTIDYEEYFNRRMYGCSAAGLMTGWNQ